MIDFDFHIHSASHSGCAGQTVKEAVKKAYDSGIRTIALCDHNCIDGLEEARIECKKLGMTFVNGVELSVSVDGVSQDVDGNVIHVLGYNIRPDKEVFNELKSKFDKEHTAHIKAIVAYLINEKGWNLSENICGSKELREELISNGYFTDKKQAKLFLSSKEILSRFPDKKIPISEVVDMIHSLGGLAVMAHPNNAENHVNLTIEQTNKIIKFLVGKGMDGIEVFHYSTVNENGVVENLLNQAKKYNLKVTLGSDRHYSDDRYGNNYFSMADKLSGYDFDYAKIKNFWKEQ
ncbi:MAG: PHP domain-containing protein [Clostridia bacterium]|nr:PHP domain-containing protein [Clostridia bacterium]